MNPLLPPLTPQPKPDESQVTHGAQAETVTAQLPANPRAARLIRKLLRLLTDKEARALERHVIMGHSHKEISKELGISVEAVRDLVRRARNQLNANL